MSPPGPSTNRVRRAAMAPDRDTNPSAASPPIRSYVLRGGRMGSGQIRALSVLGPRFMLPFQEAALDPAAAFGRVAPVVLEVGFGMGQATAAMAAARPEDDFIGIEVHEAGVGALLQRIEQLHLGNLRIVRHDAVDVLRSMIAPASLAAVYVFFPDPWPKKRHWKRRLVQPPFAALAASRLEPGGVLHCATDWQPYAEQMLEVLRGEPSLENTAADYGTRPAYRPETKFERRGLALGHGVWDLVFRKRA